jgi:hypothetical protein
MAFFTEAVVRNRAFELRASSSYQATKSAEAILLESSSTRETSFDVFLSHSVNDAELVLGVAAILKRHGLSVYVDWIADRQLDRSKVSTETAELLRNRMRQSKSMVYIHSHNSGASKWMPWELGYFDGFRAAVAIFPILKSSGDSFVGQEYLGLYPYVDGSDVSLWVNRGFAPPRLFRGAESFKNFTVWLNEQQRAA